MSRPSRSAGPRLRLITAGGVAAIGLLASAAPASAMTVGPGCTIQQAVAAVNSADNTTACGNVVAGGTTTITLPSGTYTLNGELKVNAGANLAIVGRDPSNPGQQVLDGDGKSRVLEVASGATVSLSALKVTHGFTTPGLDGTSPYTATQSADGGGILNAGTLSLDHVIVSGNATGHGGRGNDGALGKGGNPGGAGIYSGNGGGIANSGSLSVTASTITGNATGDGGAGGNGGAGQLGLGNIPNGGPGGNGAPSGAGGGIFNDANAAATITTSTISGNSTGRGGNGGLGGQGVAGGDMQPQGDGGSGGAGGNNGRQYVLRGDTSTSQSAKGVGGGIASFGSLSVSASTIGANNTGAGGNGGGAGISGPSTGGIYYGNQSGGLGGGGGSGGGIFSGGGAATGTIINVTITKNVAGDGGHSGNGAQSGGSGPGLGGFGGEGGGVWSQGAPSNGQPLDLDYVTIVDNRFGAGGGSDGTQANLGAPGVGGGIRTGGRTSGSQSTYGLSLKNSIVASNGVPNCSVSYAGTTYASDIHDAGHNLTYQLVAVGDAADASCPGIAADPKLGLLQNNGGPTFTLLPATGSPAIGAATCDRATDQRGFDRPTTGCDIGAVEAGGGSGPVTPAATTTTLGSSQNPSTSPELVTFTATVGPTPDGGYVRFTEDGQPIDGCAQIPLGGLDHASCAVQYGLSGSRTIVAEFLGTAAFAGSTSASLRQVVNPGAGGSGAGGTTTPTPTPTPTATPDPTPTPTPVAVPAPTPPPAANNTPLSTTTNGGGAPSAAALAAFLQQLGSPSGAAARIAALLKAGGYTYTTSAPAPGKLLLAWIIKTKGKGARAARAGKASSAKTVTVASSTVTVAAAGPLKAKIKLTPKGRQLLKHGRLKVTATSTFTPTGGKPVTTAKSITLKP